MVDMTSNDADVSHTIITHRDPLHCDNEACSADGQ